MMNSSTVMLVPTSGNKFLLTSMTCPVFQLQCSVYFSSQEIKFDKDNVAQLISWLTGKALEWANDCLDDRGRHYADIIATCFITLPIEKKQVYRCGLKNACFFYLFIFLSRIRKPFTQNAARLVP